MDKYLREHPPELDVVFLLELPVETIIMRLAGRRICDRCSKTYHVQFYRLDRCSCGGRLIQREDDNPKTIRHRMEVYEAEIQPIKDFYQERGLLYPVDASQGMEETFTDMCEVLDRIILPSAKKEAARIKSRVVCKILSSQ